MKTISNFKYYRVYKNDTAVREVSANDFKPKPTEQLAKSLIYFLPTGDLMYYDYVNRIDAMEKAKSGALMYIHLLIKEAEMSILKLKQYRADHYEDLNINLLDSNIRRLENEMNIK